MRELPTGTVTLLFTDVEGSTALLHELGAEAYSEVLQEHRRVLREAFERHGGVEVDTQGDAFFAAFATPRGALAAAREAQDELARGPISVRMGLHTGDPNVTDEGYVGEDVHLGARIAAAGHGGQVLLSRATQELVDGEVTYLGEHRIKDFVLPVAIFQFGSATFPPLKTVGNTNLPRPASSFLGREREVAEVVALVREGARLVTLSGPGGTGKTRLAIEAAAELVPEFNAGVFWVGLAVLRDPALVTETIAQTLGAREDLAAHIGERELLLLLDNLEQVVDAAPELAALLERCPNLSLLVTSREVLRVRGEAEYPVPPLAEAEAVDLFGDRSRLEADDDVVALCRRLDNLPLAVELAAARTSVLSPAQILERMGQCLDLLRGGRDADPRQQTLRATIEWSHDLLQSGEQQLFARLAVFAGGCSLSGAEEIAGADLDTLQSLVDKSLVRHTGERFWMLETIREYALARLAEAGEDVELRRRHAEHYLVLAESANLSVEALGHGPQRHDLVVPEQANLRSAIDWAAESDPELGLRLAVALENFWATNNPAEGARRLRALLERVPDGAVRQRARGLRALGGMTQLTGDPRAAEALYERSRRLFEQIGDAAGATMMLFRIGTAARSNAGRARRLTETSLDGFIRTGNKAGESMALGTLGMIEALEGGGREASGLLERSAALAHEIGFFWWEASMLGELAEVLLEGGELEQGATHARESLAVFNRIGDRENTVFVLAVLSRAASERAEAERAGKLWGAIEAEERRGRMEGWEQQREQHASVLSAVAGDEFERGRLEGSRLSLDEAVTLALSID